MAMRITLTFRCDGQLGSMCEDSKRTITCMGLDSEVPSWVQTVCHGDKWSLALCNGRFLLGALAG